MAPRVERRLAAILAADVVGYSRLMQADEAGTHARLKALRQDLIEPRIADHAGRIVKLTGDGALVEFASVVEAVLAAADIQRAVTEHQADVAEAERIAFRIGINLGDVIFDEADIYGDGVNVAARLEALAEPGGVFVARTVYNHVRGKLDLGFEPAGAHQVKNIAEPVEVYRVRWDGQATGAVTQGRRPPAQSWRRWAWPTAAAVVLLILAGGAAWWSWTGVVPEKSTAASAGPAGTQAKPALPLPDQPSIAVLPFENLSGDPKQERLAGGLTEDVITDLSRFRELFVIARNSTEVYKGKAVDIRQVGRELGVQYVLEGSLQIDGDRVRITAQLIDATTGNHLWAERYDRPLDDIFAIQDEVTQKIVGALGGWWGRLAQAGRENVHRKPPKSLDAYDLFLLGIELKHRHTREDNQKAQEVLKRAIALDPEFAGPYAVLAFSYLNDAAMGFGDDPAQSLRNMRAVAEQGAKLDDADAMAHLALAIANFDDHQIEAGANEFERALTLGQNNADLLAIVAYNRPSKLPKGKEDVENIKRAMRLNPHYPEWYLVALGYAAYHGGLYHEAIAGLRQVTSQTMLEVPLYLALSYAKLGRQDEAAAAVKELLRIEPEFSAERQIDGDVFRDQGVIDHFIGNVREAGLPVCMTEEQLSKYSGTARLPQCEQERLKS